MLLLRPATCAVTTEQELPDGSTIDTWARYLDEKLMQKALSSMEADQDQAQAQDDAESVDTVDGEEDSDGEDAEEEEKGEKGEKKKKRNGAARQEGGQKKPSEHAAVGGATAVAGDVVGVVQHVTEHERAETNKYTTVRGLRSCGD